eukprot:TRINITY_DN60921_c0_g1_i2.p1 TRINITY_DN60921_c0_g1~~TRINITY_DN60921_c0_g1_i2.p1  ORF type:complete len:427 (-),score=205.75 TRINITY_DN60921_c0_g1_i2:298-1578(-)
MGSCIERVTGRDPDEVFAYNTIKVVRIKDRYLGMLRLFLLLVIFLYIVGYVLIYQQKYLEIEVPVGSVATSLKKPGHLKIDVSQYPYCKNYSGSEHFLDPAECVAWDADQIVYPPAMSDSMLITTRIKTTEEWYICKDPTAGPCPAELWTNNRTLAGVNFTNATGEIAWPVTQFMAGVDAYSVWVKHNMQARLFFSQTGDDHYAAASSEMTGRLIDRNGDVLQTFGLGPDYIYVSTFLQAAGADLSRTSHAQGADPHGGDSQRSEGIILLVAIIYSNLKSEQPTYEYSVTQIPQAEYKVVESRISNDNMHRINIDRHGIQLVFLTTGQIGRPDFQTTLIQLVSALGLLSVAALVVEMSMLYIMPHKKYYNKYKYQETVDFSDLRDAEEDGLDVDQMTDPQFSASLNADLASMRRPFVDGDAQDSSQ